MRRPFVCGVGGVVSADIAVPEHERELAFYSRVLTSGESPLWRDDLMNNLGSPVIGLGARTPEYDSLPLQWMPHFQVADVGSSAQNAIKMGGQELVHSKSEDGQSQWAVMSDPMGAGFGLIPAVEEMEDSTAGEHLGCIAWLSLAVPDAEAGRDFYESVVGWKGVPLSPDANDDFAARFEMRIDRETAAAEICQYSDDAQGVPPVWLLHLPVGDLAESLRRVGEQGGEVIIEAANAEYAIIRDPVGVHFALQAG